MAPFCVAQMEQLTGMTAQQMSGLPQRGDEYMAQLAALCQNRSTIDWTAFTRAAALAQFLPDQIPPQLQGFYNVLVPSTELLATLLRASLEIRRNAKELAGKLMLQLMDAWFVATSSFDLQASTFQHTSHLTTCFVCLRFFFYLWSAAASLCCRWCCATRRSLRGRRTERTRG